MAIFKGKYSTRSVYIDGNLLIPVKSWKVRNHSPDGFSWGYSGSGCAQLALAILLEFIDEKGAELLYQDFKTEFVAGLPQDNFEIEYDVKKWVAAKIKQYIIENRLPERASEPGSFNHWVDRGGDFVQSLCNAVILADSYNLDKLRSVYPQLVAAKDMSDWNIAPEGFNHNRIDCPENVVIKHYAAKMQVVQHRQT